MIGVSFFEYLHKMVCWDQKDGTEQVKYWEECQKGLSGQIYQLCSRVGGGGLPPESGSWSVGCRKEHPGTLPLGFGSEILVFGPKLPLAASTW